MSWDCELILTGGCARYWDQVRPLLKPTDRIAVIIPYDLYQDNRFEEPYWLLGTYNYASLAGVVNAWGYSPTAPIDQLYTKTYAFYPFGAYHPPKSSASWPSGPISNSSRWKACTRSRSPSVPAMGRPST